MVDGTDKGWAVGLRRARGCSIVLVMLVTSGCFYEMPVPAPDQSQFDDLSVLKSSGEAIARLYTDGPPIFDGIVVHSWFVVKPAGHHPFERWEVWTTDDGIYDYVHKDMFPPDYGFADPPPIILAELIGPEAEPIVKFIREHCSEYPHRNEFVLLAGPNCNTFVQWILDSTGWDVTLPRAAVGANGGGSLDD